MTRIADRDWWFGSFSVLAFYLAKRPVSVKRQRAIDPRSPIRVPDPRSAILDPRIFTELLMNRKMDITIRDALPSDADALARLRYEFRSSLRTPTERPEEFLPRCARWMSERLGHSKWHCWLAERDGQVVGSLWCSLIEKIPNPVDETELHAYITNVYLRAEERGSGAGNALLTTALDWCRVHSVDSVILWPTERSRSLYERHGFAVRDDLLELKLSQ